MYKKLIDRYKLYKLFVVLKLTLHHKLENSILEKAFSVFKAAVKSVLSCKIVFHQLDIEWVSGAFRPKRNLRPQSHVFVVRVVSFGLWKKKDCWKRFECVVVVVVCSSVKPFMFLFTTHCVSFESENILSQENYKQRNISRCHLMTVTLKWTIKCNGKQVEFHLLLTYAYLTFLEAMKCLSSPFNSYFTNESFVSISKMWIKDVHRYIKYNKFISFCNTNGI